LQAEQCLFSSNVSIHPNAPFFVTRYLDVVVDSLFFIDIGLNFVSARWVLEVEPMEHWCVGGGGGCCDYEQLRLLLLLLLLRLRLRSLMLLLLLLLLRRRRRLLLLLPRPLLMLLLLVL